MKYLIIIFFLSIGIAYGQSTVYLRADSVKVMKQGGNANLQILNATRDSISGVLLNIGNGVTKFQKVRAISSSQFVVGTDTITITGAVGGIQNAPGTGDSLLFLSGDYIRLVAGEFGVTTTQYTNEVGIGADTSNIPTRYTIDSLGQIIVGNFPTASLYEGLPGAVDSILFWRNDSTLLFRTPIPGYGILSDLTNASDTTRGWKADTSLGGLATKLYVLYVVDSANLNQNWANADLTFTGNRLHDLDGNELLIVSGGDQVMFAENTGTTSDAQFSADLNSLGTLAQMNLFSNTTSSRTDFLNQFQGYNLAQLTTTSSATEQSFKFFFSGENPSVLFRSSVYNADSTALIFPISATTNTGDFALAHDTVTGQIVRIPMTGGSGVTTMAAIGAVPNANGASISGSTLTLQPADGSFGGVVTASAQTLGAGIKTFSSNPRIPFSAFNPYSTTTEFVSIEGTNGAIAKFKRGDMSRTIYEQINKTTTYAVNEDDPSVFTGDATSGAFSFNLPALGTFQGRTYTFKKIDASGNAVTIEPDGTETIDGASNYALGTQWKYVTITATATQWLIIANN